MLDKSLYFRISTNTRIEGGGELLKSDAEKDLTKDTQSELSGLSKEFRERKKQEMEALFTQAEKEKDVLINQAVLETLAAMGINSENKEEAFRLFDERLKMMSDEHVRMLKQMFVFQTLERTFAAMQDSSGWKKTWKNIGRLGSSMKGAWDKGIKKTANFETTDYIGRLSPIDVTSFGTDNPFIKGFEPLKNDTQAAFTGRAGAAITTYGISRLLAVAIRHGAFSDGTLTAVLAPHKTGMGLNVITLGLTLEAMGVPALKTGGKLVKGAYGGMKELAFVGARGVDDFLSGNLHFGEVAMNPGDTLATGLNNVTEAAGFGAFSHVDHEFKSKDKQYASLIRGDVENSNLPRSAIEGMRFSPERKERLRKLDVMRHQLDYMPAKIKAPIQKMIEAETNGETPELSEEEISQIAEYLVQSTKVTLDPKELFVMHQIKVPNMLSKEGPSLSEADMESFFHTSANSFLLQYFHFQSQGDQQKQFFTAYQKAETKVKEGQLGRLVKTDIDEKTKEYYRLRGGINPKHYFRIVSEGNTRGVDINNAKIRKELASIQKDIDKNPKGAVERMASLGLSGSFIMVYLFAFMAGKATTWIFDKAFNGQDAKQKKEPKLTKSPMDKAVKKSKYESFFEKEGKGEALSFKSALSAASGGMLLQSFAENHVLAPSTYLHKGGLNMQFHKSQAAYRKTPSEHFTYKDLLNKDDELILTEVAKILPKEPSAREIQEALLKDLKAAVDGKGKTLEGKVQSFIDAQESHKNMAEDVRTVVNNFERDTKKSVTVQVSLKGDDPALKDFSIKIPHTGLRSLIGAKKVGGNQKALQGLYAAVSGDTGITNTGGKINEVIRTGSRAVSSLTGKGSPRASVFNIKATSEDGINHPPGKKGTDTAKTALPHIPGSNYQFSFVDGQLHVSWQEINVGKKTLGRAQRVPRKKVVVEKFKIVETS